MNDKIIYIYQHRSELNSEFAMIVNVFTTLNLYKDAAIDIVIFLSSSLQNAANDEEWEGIIKTVQKAVTKLFIEN